MEQEKSIRDELKEMKSILEEKVTAKKTKPFKIPFRARLNKSKLNKGYVTVAILNDNMNVDFQREAIVDGTIKLDDTYHAIEEFDIFNYKGKPFIFQPKSKLNPYNPFRNPLEGKSETYGQKYIMARMEGDKIITKKKIGWGIGIGALIVAGIIAYAVFSGGFK